MQNYITFLLLTAILLTGCEHKPCPPRLDPGQTPGIDMDVEVSSDGNIRIRVKNNRDAPILIDRRWLDVRYLANLYDFGGNQIGTIPVRRLFADDADLVSIEPGAHLDHDCGCIFAIFADSVRDTLPRKNPMTLRLEYNFLHNYRDSLAETTSPSAIRIVKEITIKIGRKNVVKVIE